MTDVAPGFEEVASAFAEVAAAQPRGGLAFSATLKGQTVVDLCAGEAAPGRPWAPTTQACTMSVAKGLAGLCIAMLVDRGRLELDVPLTTWWPEFGRHGKDVVTLRHVLLHQAGVLGLPDVGATLGSGAAAWTDLDAIARALEDAVPAWTPGTRSGYHAVTYGWLLGELVRRTDGRTLGTFFREEVAEPLGVETAIGVAEPVFRDLAIAHPQGATGGDSPVTRLLLGRMSRLARDPKAFLGMAFLSDGTSSVLTRAETLLLEPDWFRAEIPSSNGVTSAHDLARLFAALAMDGELDGTRLLSAQTLQTFATTLGTPRDVVMRSGLSPMLRPLLAPRLEVPRALGWIGNAPRKGWGAFGPSPRAIGAAGLGGHFAFADPDARVSAAFVRTAYSSSAKAQTQLTKALYSALP